MPFTEIIGHQKEIKRLQRLIHEGRVPHALLMTGPEGIGKRLTAMGLAKAILCGRMEDDYCDACTSCKTINQGNHPDFTIIQPEGSSIKIDQLRDWQRGIQSRPYIGSFKVTIIDQAEKMTASAANSILKVLEEPPGDTVIFLICIEARDILPTIVSRCQVIRFSPLTRPEFIKIIMDHCNIDKTQAGLIYNLSKGQLSRGLDMDVDTVQKSREEWRKTLDAPSFLHQTWSQPDKNALIEGLEIMAHWWRDIIFLQLGVDESMLTHQDMLVQLKGDAEKISPLMVKKRIDLILKTMEAVEKNANARLALDCLFWQWNN